MHTNYVCTHTGRRKINCCNNWSLNAWEMQFPKPLSEQKFCGEQVLGMRVGSSRPAFLQHRANCWWQRRLSHRHSHHLTGTLSPLTTTLQHLANWTSCTCKAPLYASLPLIMCWTPLRSSRARYRIASLPHPLQAAAPLLSFKTEQQNRFCAVNTNTCTYKISLSVRLRHRWAHEFPGAPR